MTEEEAKRYAENMTYHEAICNLKQAKSVPYRKATFIKVNELLDELEREPIKGHWIVNKEKNLAICSNCKFHLKDKDEIKLLGTFTQGYNHCPTCGADMREVKANGNEK